MSDETHVYTIAPSIETTFSLEIVKTGLQKKRRHYLFFEDYCGEIHYHPDDLAACRGWFKIKTASLVCRDKWLKPAKQKAVADFAQKELQADTYPEIEFRLRQFKAKAVRGYCAEGAIKIKQTTRDIKVNLVVNPGGQDRLVLDGDSTLGLRDFDIIPPSRFWGLIGTKNEALVRFLLWASPAHS